MNKSYIILLNIINILLASAVLFVVSVSLYFIYLHTFGKSYIQKNWSSEKCNLFVFPMSHMYTNDPMKNINYCSRAHSDTLMSYLKQPMIILINVFKYLQNAIIHMIQYTKENYNGNEQEKKANTNRLKKLKPLKFKQQ